MPAFISDQRRLDAARRIFEHLAKVVDIPFSLRLWDGTMVSLGHDATEHRYFSISSPGVLGSLLRRPSLENFFRHYVSGHIDVHGSDLIACLEVARAKRKESNIRIGDLRKGFPWVQALPLLFARDQQVQIGHQVEGAEAGRAQTKGDDKDLIQFHYDTSNAFYALFLDPEMVYSCGYFTDWSNSLDQAQRDKLDIICRKLRLQPDESFLDIGSGWGSLLCHAAQHYGVRAHGVTLSQAQFDYAKDKIERLGLQDRVTVALCDYSTLEGRYDKIASIGMYEHVGIANYEAYFKKIRELLNDRGIFLNHGITRRAKRNIKNFGKISPGKRVILKYIFPGSELDHIGHTLQVMESCGSITRAPAGCGTTAWRRGARRRSRWSGPSVTACGSPIWPVSRAGLNTGRRTCSRPWRPNRPSGRRRHYRRPATTSTGPPRRRATAATRRQRRRISG